MSLIDVKVPDIGDFKDVPVIEIHVNPGDTVAPEAPLITLESDKATMEVPSPLNGRVSEVLVRIGDKVSEGTPILRLDAGEGAAPQAEEAVVPPAVHEQVEVSSYVEPPAPGRSVPPPIDFGGAH